MATRHLNDDTTLDGLRHQAKALHKSVLTGERSALERVSPYFQKVASVTLQQVQLVIAREYGFSSWSKLKARIEKPANDAVSEIDVFVSYAAADRDRVMPLVEAFETNGINVWTDRDLATGDSVDRQIESALDAAQCVVAVWSENSIESEFCLAEADAGKDKLVEVCIDDVQAPMADQSITTVSLNAWPEERSQLNTVLSGVRACLGS